MVTGSHPEDVDLFDYVEGGLPAGERAEIEAHLASCAQCGERVSLAQAGRETLRGSPPLELPLHSRDELLAGLPSQQRERRRRRFSLKPVIAVATPLVAVTAIVVALSTTSGGNGDESAAVGDTSQAMTVMPETAEGGGEARQDSVGKDRLSVAGPPAEVAADLRAQGFDAVALADRVEVRDATRAEVRRALQGRRDGSVRIVIVP
jgi:anti-sigma factor RsiW